MIISASRRTDIPAFYGEWFYNRIKVGFVKTRNPFNAKQIRTLRLTPEEVECIVFWTKDPLSFLAGLDNLQNFNYYFLFTLNAYPNTIERYLPPVADLIDTFQRLSSLIGPDRVIWRYDPILFCRGINLDFHLANFDNLAQKLSGFTHKCIFSFLDFYKKTVRKMSDLDLINPDISRRKALLSGISEIASFNKIELNACCEPDNYSELNIKKARCIDTKLIEELSGKKINPGKDPNQRNHCGCVRSVDIGAYNTCKHGCLYCYADSGSMQNNRNSFCFDPEAEYL